MTANEKFAIRKALPQDAAALADCMDAAYAAYASRIDDMPDMAAGCADDIEQNLVWVAEVDKAVVGGLVLIAKPDHLVLANVAIRPECQGVGLGRVFMDMAEKEASARGYREMRLNTHAAMPENVALYQHLGWREIERRDNTVSMRKPL